MKMKTKMVKKTMVKKPHRTQTPVAPGVVMHGFRLEVCHDHFHGDAGTPDALNLDGEWDLLQNRQMQSAKISSLERSPDERCTSAVLIPGAVF